MSWVVVVGELQKVATRDSKIFSPYMLTDQVAAPKTGLLRMADPIGDVALQGRA